MSAQRDPQTYQRVKNWSFLVGLFLDVIVLLFFFLSGLSLRLKETVTSWTDHALLVYCAYLIIFALIMFAVHFPLNYFLGYYWEKKFGLGNQSLTAWMIDEFKKAILGLLVFLIMVGTVYIFLGQYPQYWWIGAGVFWLLLTYVLAKLTPNMIIPLFYKYSDLKNAPLKEKIKNLFEACHVNLKGVYAIDFSTKTKKANAFVCGLGKTRRVVLSDTLLERFSDDEIETVVAHELAHYKNKDVFRMLLVNSLTTFSGLYLVHLFLMTGIERFGLREINDIAFFPMAALAFMLFGVCVTPLVNGYSRLIERKADAFSLKMTGKKKSFISMMKKLSEMNLAEENPGFWVELFLFDHPPTAKRIRFAEQFS